MVTDPFLIGIMYGFVPAMGFLYILLHEYQQFFSEKRVFRTFFIGLLVGIPLTLGEQYMSAPVLRILQEPVTTLDATVQLVVFAGLIGVLEAFVYAAVLNWRTFRGRRDTPFYGVAFGLGAGATHVLVLIFIILRKQELSGAALGLSVFEDVVLLSLIGLYFIGGILVAASVGGWIGQGTGVGPLTPWVVRAALVRGLYEGIFYAMLAARPPIWGHLLAVAGVALGIWLVATVLMGLLDKVVPPEILREIGIHNRRLARRVLRDDKEEPR